MSFQCPNCHSEQTLRPGFSQCVVCGTPFTKGSVEETLVIGLPRGPADLPVTVALVPEDSSENQGTEAKSQVPCPHCRHVTTVGRSQKTARVQCESCGGNFNVDSETTQAWLTPSLGRIDKYELIRRIGQGAFGSVFSARDTELDRMVAIKVPRSGTFISKKEEEQFIREARNAARLHHRHIVQVFDAGHDGECPYIVTELVQGATLQEWLKSRRSTHRQAAEFVATLAEALHYAHERGIVHRDLKPGNVMIDIQGEPRVMDFGLAKRDQVEVTVTIDGQVLGTPAYMSPEQARGYSHLADARSDVYSLGVILFELLTGERPFRGNSAMLLNSVIHVDPPSPRSLDQLISRDLETIGLKCLQKIPEKRYSTAKELAEDLRRHLRNEPILARPISRAERAWRWCQRNRPIVLSAMAIATTMLIAIFFVSASWIAEMKAHEKASALAVTNKKLYESERESRLAAVASRQQALRRLRDARQAVDTSLTEFSEALRLFPGVAEARERVLFKAAEDYLKFAQDHADDPELELERARALVRLALVKRELHEHEEAARVLDASINALVDLRKQRTDSAPVAVELANAYAQRGLLAASAGALDAAQQDYLVAENILKPLLAKPDLDESTLDSLATLLVDSSVLLVQIGNIDESAVAAQQAVSHFEELAKRSPRTARYRLGVATAQDVLGQTLFQRGRYAESVESYEKAVNALSSLISQDQENAEYLQTRAVTRLRLAGTLRAQGRIRDELKSLADSAKDFELLVQARPDVPAYEDNLAVGWIDLGIVHSEQGLTAQARADLEQAQRLLDKLTHRYPEEAQYLEHQAACWQALGNVLSDLDENEQAQRRLEEAASRYQMLADALPTVMEYRERAAIAATHLGRFLHKIGKLDLAAETLQRAGQELEKLVEEIPNVVAYRDEAAHALYRLGLVLRDQNQAESSQACFQKARKWWDEVTSGDEISAEYSANFARLLIECPERGFRDVKHAAALALRARTAAPQNPFYLSLYGHVLIANDDFKKGLEALSEAELLHGTAIARDDSYRAIAHAKLQEPEKARAAWERAASSLKQSQPGNTDLQFLLQEAGKLAGVESKGSSTDSKLGTETMCK